MPIKFLKTQQKLRNNLTKQFQTFNQKPDDNNEASQKYDSGAVKKSTLTQYKPPKSTIQQMTTQAKSPLVKSASGSKFRLPQQQKTQYLSGQPSNNKSLKSSKKSLHQSLSKPRPHTPAEQLARSRQSSPQAQRLYSKMSSYDKRAFSKMSNYKKPQLTHTNDHQATYGAKSSSKASFSKVEKEKNSQKHKDKQSTVSRLTNEKSSSKIKKSLIKNNESQNYQISFPQMITQSQSVYPSSSQPNTGKESQGQTNENWQRKRNSNITEEQENDIEVPIKDDYISEGQLTEQQMGGSSNPSNLMSENEAPFNQQGFTSSGYHQIPKSYLIAMQILQAKVIEQQTTIKKLKQKVQKQNTKYQTLENQFQSLQAVISDQQKMMSQKDAQIRFLKGYLDEQKHNNRQALKEVAKNVYQRSISAKKFTQTNNDDSETQSMKKTKKQLFFEDENEKQNIKNRELRSKRKSSTKDPANFRNQVVQEILIEEEERQNHIQAEQSERQEKQTENIQQIEQSEQSYPVKKLSKPQIKQQKVQTKASNHTEKKQRKLQSQKQSQYHKEQLRIQQQFAHEELVKDQMMREQLLKEQALKIETQKKFNYLQRSRKNDRSVSVKQAYPYTVKKLQLESSARKRSEEGERQLYSEGKRVRSMSTAVKYLDQQKNPNITYRPRNTQTSNINPSFSYQGPPTATLNPSVQSIMDPVIERYIQAKSDISSYRFNNDTAFFNQPFDLKNEKKHQKTVSQMRELMRGEKQLVALNYRLESIERRILECVKSTGKEDQLGKTNRQQAEQKILLQELQKQYTILKKEFQRKELSVKQLKLNLEQK